jgi:F-type H+-transporting ATPase subunit b
VLTAVVTHLGPSQFEVALSRLPSAEEGDKIGNVKKAEECEFPPPGEDSPRLEADGSYTCGEGPSPLAIEPKELAWGAGAFIVFALLMRLFLYPRLRKGMDARYAHIRQGHEDADAMRTAAQSAVAEYEAALAAVKAEANAVLEEARGILEGERQAQISAANERIAARLATAAAAASEARQAAQAQVESAVADVAATTVELTLGRRPDPEAVRRAVADVMSAGVAR